MLFLLCFLPFLGLGVGMAGNKVADVVDQQVKKSRLTDLEFQVREKELKKQLADLDAK